MENEERFNSMKLSLSLKICSLLALASAAEANALEISFEGQTHTVISVTPEKSIGLDHIYVAYSAAELSRMVISGTKGNLTAMRYSNLGGGYAEPVGVVNNGTTAYIDNPQCEMGYILQDGDRATYIWLIGYLSHRLTLTGASAYPEQECDNTRISTSGSGEPIYYYTIDGRQRELSRDIKVSYNTLVWNEESENYDPQEQEKVLSHLSNPIMINPPIYCDTEFTISGDRFLEEWGMGESVVSPTVIANGLEVHTSAEQTNLPDDDSETGSNIIREERTYDLGGSAPADISFRAFVTDAVIHKEWQIADDENFEYITYRFNQQDLDYTFDEEGTYYVRFVGSNNDGSCEAYGDVYTVGIGSSELRIPNAFSPNDDGINDEWKVGYRSLLSFDCSIFDRYGNLLYHFSDPSLGWDGKYKGKKVKSGVYYYVIEAKGADGKKYKKGGDINIIDYKSRGDAPGGSTSTPTE